MNSICKNNIHPIEKIEKKPNERIQLDSRFLEELKRIDEPASSIGKKLLSRIRESEAGRFRYSPVSKRFVESPDAYWSIQIEWWSKRFCIVVFGSPEEHRPVHTIKMNKFMESYSVFNIDSSNQIDEAAAKITDAKKMMRNNKKLNYCH